MTYEPTRNELVDEGSKWGVGLGILMFALFPLAVPILLLTAVALLPLLVPALVLGLLAAVLVLPVRAIRRLQKRANQASPDSASNRWAGRAGGAVGGAHGRDY